MGSSGVHQNDGERKDIIVLNNVHKTYLLGVEGVPALRGVSVKIKEGEFVVVLGTSGGGKTTLLNIIGTIDKPTKGDVWINGIRIKSSTDDKLLANLRLNYLAFVFQTFNLIGSLTALENVELPMILMVLHCLMCVTRHG
jgi:putative ABC transport system ATP-binding protein